jgi:phage host-nuclease inhibitor protein Gam
MIMGIITELTNEADRVQRRADQQVALGNRRVTKQNAQADTLKGEMAPLQEVINHYNNETVPAYNTSVANYNGGFLTGNGVNTFSQWNPGYKTDKEYWMPSNLAPRNPSGFNSTVLAPAGYNKTQVYTYADGTPVYSFNKYAEPAALDSSAAQNADAALKARQGDIDTLNASGKSIERRNGLMAQRAEREGERLNTNIEMNQRAINEAQAPQQSTSVFDQNMAGIHQTIADWLK